jgi:hypothetical protein
MYAIYALRTNFMNPPSQYWQEYLGENRGEKSCGNTKKKAMRSFHSETEDILVIFLQMAQK